MKKFFLALLAATLIFANGNAADAAAPQITQEQFEQIVGRTVQSPAAASAATLNLNAATFQKNFNAFMTNFIGETSAKPEEAAQMAQIFTLNDAKTFNNGEKEIFTKSFLNRAVVIGLSDIGGNFKVLNFFAAQAEDRDDALFDVLILQAFVRGITPDFNAIDLLNAAKNNPDGSVIHGGVKYSVVNVDNLNVVSATVAQ